MHEQRGKPMQQCLVKLIITIYVKNKSTVLFCSTFILYVKCAILPEERVIVFLLKF